MAASLRKEPGVEVELVNGDPGEFTAAVDGRVVASELDDLGAAVVGSYLGSRGPDLGRYGGYGDWFGGRGFWVDE